MVGELRKILTIAITAGCVLALASHAGAQHRVQSTIFGVQFRPIVPSKFFSASAVETTVDELKAEFAPRFGYNTGMVIRHSLNKMWSIETGITFTQRNYRLTLSKQGMPEPHILQYRLIGYEIPFQGLIFVQLGQRLWMNGSGGISFDLFPSNVESSTYSRRDSITYDSYQKTWRNGWLQFSALVNYGFEYRTPKDGRFYLGASYHRPLGDIAESRILFIENLQRFRISQHLSGNYLTLDLRYFFRNE